VLPVVAIVGRPNVGKSTLFNRLVGSRQALVDDREGVTRDRHYGMATLGDREIICIDTGGFEPDPRDDLFAKVRAQAETAIAEADVVLFVVDRQAGRTPADDQTADIMRRATKSAEALRAKLILVVNKCDSHTQEEEAAEFWGLGVSPMLCVSAEHGRGIYDLWDAIAERLPEVPEAEEDEEDDSEIRIAVIGRPNIGKSTLVNRLVGEDRHVVHDAPGTTMDAVDSLVTVGERTYRLVDTAGVRRRAKIHDHLEGFATSRAIKAIERCHVTLLMLDGTEGIAHQDARLAALVESRGRAVVVLVNKWDQVKADPDRNVKTLMHEMERRLPHMDWAPVLFISALTGKGVGHIFQRVEAAYKEFDKRISTAELNKFLEAAVETHSVPQKHHRPVRLNYMTQARVRPPTFIIWSNSPDAVRPPYRRYLENQLRQAYGFLGTPLRIQLRKKRKPGEEKQS
jgi:GTP-binding protein